MTDRIAEIRERASRATEGPWVCPWEPLCDNGEMYGRLRASEKPLATIYGDNAVWLPEGEDRSNGAFIAHARDDIPYLLAQLDAARAEVERLRAAIQLEVVTLTESLDGSTHYEGCEKAHPRCATLNRMKIALMPRVKP